MKNWDWDVFGPALAALLTALLIAGAVYRGYQEFATWVEVRNFVVPIMRAQQAQGQPRPAQPQAPPPTTQPAAPSK